MSNWRRIRSGETSEWLQALKWFGVALAIGVGFGIYVFLGERPLGASPAPTATAIWQSSRALTPIAPQGTIAPPPPTQPPPAQLAVGVPAPDFTLTTLDGASTVSLSQLRGQPVLINFWASWCLPCRTETPDLERAYQKYRAQGLVVLGINSAAQDTLEAATDFVKEFKVTYPQLWDEADAVLQAYSVLGLPTSLFVNREGRVQRVKSGALSAAQIDEFVGEILP